NENSQIRSNAVGCLQSVARAAPKLLYPHWNHLLPDSHASMPSTSSLFTLIQYEAMPESSMRTAKYSNLKTDLKCEDVNTRTASMMFLVRYARELAAACGSR
ncbi:35340_t:CDS:2, partial [Gigaspora margarita]